MYRHEGPDFAEAVIVTGTPGVGKTTLARLLARRIGAKYLRLGVFAKETDASNRFDAGRRTRVLDLRKVRNKLNQLIRESARTVVVDGHEAAGAVSRGLVSRVILLRLNPVVLKRRLERRNYRKVKTKENLEAELLDGVLFDLVRFGLRDKTYEIDTTGRSVSSILNEAINAIRQRLQKTGRVNWIDKLEQERRFESIL